MKKTIILLSIFVMSLSLCACGKSEAVKNVEALIDSIDTINAGSGSEISAAKSAYNALSEEEQNAVENYAQLETLKTEYEEYMMSTVDDIVDDLDYYSYDQRLGKLGLLNLYYDYMTDEEKAGCLAICLFYEEAPDYVQGEIKEALKNPSSYTLYDIETVDSGLLLHDPDDDDLTGWVKMTYGGTNSFGAMVKDTSTVFVKYSVDIETKSIDFGDIAIRNY